MPETATGKPRILIADDEPSIREVLYDALSDSYECTAVGSAEEALALLSVEKFALVLSDIVMREMSGLEMVPQVLQRSPDTVVVMISGEQNIESAIKAMRAGAFDYITKPFDLRHVEAAVRRALDHQALRQTKRFYEHHLEELVEKRTAERDHLAYHDALINLPNRRLFEDRLDQALTHAEHHKQSLAVMFVNINRFKTINDTLGHSAGDKLLRAVSDRLIHCVSEGDTVARFGDDEFALLFRQINSAEDAASIAHRIHEAFKSSFQIDIHKHYVSASIGIGIFPVDGQDAHSLLKNANTALCRAKEQTGNDLQFYSVGMNSKAVKRLALEDDLRRALEREEFVLHYQPQIELSTGSVIGMEALVRWQHPEAGMISPAEFIPIAEETGLIVPLGEWVLQTACAQKKYWHESGFANLRISVNLSPRQFHQHDVLETITRVLEKTGIEPSELELELTESSLMKNTEEAIKTLNELRLMGIQSAIDDFGTGYSSLSYLQHLPIDILKIDQSFVRDATANESNAAIIKAIITLGHSLNLKIVAEGVETKEQLNLLCHLGCDEAQGYLFSRPIPAKEFRELLLKGRQLISRESLLSGEGLTLDSAQHKTILFERHPDHAANNR